MNEVSNLANSMQILQNEAKNPRSTLILAGDDRVRMVNDIVKGVGETLKRLEKVAKRYEILGSDSKGKHFWIKFKWSVEFSNIDGLRTKVIKLSNSVCDHIDEWLIRTSWSIITR